MNARGHVGCNVVVMIVAWHGFNLVLMPGDAGEASCVHAHDVLGCNRQHVPWSAEEGTKMVSSMFWLHGRF